MKKFISCTLILALCLAAFAGCGAEEAPAATTAAETAAAETEAVVDTANLKAAKEYLFTMYKGMKETTPTDYTVVGKVVIGTDSYEIQWTADSDTVQFVTGEDGMVTVDVDEHNPDEVHYTLSAALTDAAGNTETLEFAHKVPAFLDLVNMSNAEIAAAAYRLEDGAAMGTPTAMQGVITKIDSPWSEKYGNITVVMAVEGAEDQPITAFRLSGEGAEKLAEGDTITVAGTLKNYKGTIEFDKGCLLIANEALNDAKAAMAGYGLEDGLAMTAPVTMTGVIKSIDTEYSEEYGNITVTIVAAGLEDYAIQCYRLSGEGAKDLAEGDTITVTGTIKNYKGTIEFDKGCTLDAVAK